MPQAVATRYARALADAVLDPKHALDPRRALDELREFEHMVSGTAELRNVLLSPAVSATRKRGVVARFAQAIPLSPMVRNFIYVLIDRRRIGLIGEIAQAFEAELDARTGIVRAEIQSAAPLPESARAALEAELSRAANRKVRGQYSVDPELIGGVVARIGSTLYDGSVRTQLQNLRQRLTGP